MEKMKEGKRMMMRKRGEKRKIERKEKGGNED